MTDSLVPFVVSGVGAFVSIAASIWAAVRGKPAEGAGNSLSAIKDKQTRRIHEADQDLRHSVADAIAKIESLNDAEKRALLTKLTAAVEERSTRGQSIVASAADEAFEARADVAK